MSSEFETPTDGAYRGIPLYDLGEDRLAAARADVDAVYNLAGADELWAFLQDESRAFEARRLAGALLLARAESARATRDKMPADPAMIAALKAEVELAAWMAHTVYDPVYWDERAARGRAEYLAQHPGARPGRRHEGQMRPTNRTPSTRFSLPSSG